MIKSRLFPFLLILYGVIVGAAVTGVVWLSAAPPRGPEVKLLPTPTRNMITVHVSGAVMIPGVYSLPDGSRVQDAVMAAGGFSVGAEIDAINLAKLLVDGEQIDVPGIASLSHISIGRININTATAAELDTLPGIGPSGAQAIVDYRLEHGDFKTIEEILLVPGIGPATFEMIKDYITVRD